jgi:hypothetical protein
MQRLAFARVTMTACSLLAGGAVVATASTAAAHKTDTRAAARQPKPPLELTEPQRQQVLQAVSAKDTLDKPPPGFEPTIGAGVPSQKKLALHPLPRPLVYQIPVLKQYYYGKLPDTVLIVDPMTRKVIDAISR